MLQTWIRWFMVTPGISLIMLTKQSNLCAIFNGVTCFICVFLRKCEKELPAGLRYVQLLIRLVGNFPSTRKEMRYHRNWGGSVRKFSNDLHRGEQ